MKRKPFLLIVSAVLFAALAAGGVGYFGANPSVEQVAVSAAEAQSAPFAACSAMLKEAVAALNSLRTEADTERVGEALGKALDAVESLPEPTEADAACISRGLQAVAEAWWAAESRVCSVAYVYAPALVYQLYVRRTPLTDALSDENHAMEAMQSSDMMRLSSTDLKREPETWLQAVQGKHEARDKAVYGGGNGRSQAESIELLPFIGRKTLPPEAEMREVIFAYLREVYGSVDACYMAFVYTADGRYYKICHLYNGIFHDSEGKIQLRILPVYFRVKLAAPASPAFQICNSLKSLFPCSWGSPLFPFVLHLGALRSRIAALSPIHLCQPTAPPTALT